MAKGSKTQKKVEEEAETVEATKSVAKSVAKGGAKKGKKAKKTVSKGQKKTKGGAVKKDERYFKLIDAKTLKSFGRYTGETPKQAASKGFTKLLQKLKENGKTVPKETTIYLRESTRGSNRKVYGYSASRQKLPEPQELVIKDKETGEEKTITYHYRNKIKKVAVPEQFGGVKKTKKTKKAASPKKKATETKKPTKKKSAGSKTAKKATGKKKAAGSKSKAKKAK